MPSSRIPSPARSQGVGSQWTPRRYKQRRTRSVSSPAKSESSVKLSAIIPNSFVVSPISKRRSVLTDDTDIELPRRQSWWKKLNEDTRDMAELLQKKDIPESNNALEENFDIEVLSQEKKNYTLDIPESSDGESINSIVMPQRKLFNMKPQKEKQSHKKFPLVINDREELAKLQKSHVDHDKEINVRPKNLFDQNKKTKTKPIFPSALLNISLEKSIANKTKDIPVVETKGQFRNLFGNRQATKRKNMFADFVASDSENEIPEITAQVFGFRKKEVQKRRASIASRGLAPSPSSSNNDLDIDDWKHLPSSTMVDNQLEEFTTTPTKRTRLTNILFEEETACANTTTNKVELKNNESVQSRSRSKRLSHSKTKDIDNLMVQENDEIHNNSKNLPSSTMVDNQLEEFTTTPTKRTRLTNILFEEETACANTTTNKVELKNNESVQSRSRSKRLSHSKTKDIDNLMVQENDEIHNNSKNLPSSTMVDNQLQEFTTTPTKRTRLTNILFEEETACANTTTNKVELKNNESVQSRSRSKRLSHSKTKDIDNLMVQENDEIHNNSKNRKRQNKSLNKSIISATNKVELENNESVQSRSRSKRYSHSKTKDVDNLSVQENDEIHSNSKNKEEENKSLNKSIISANTSNKDKQLREHNDNTCLVAVSSKNDNVISEHISFEKENTDNVLDMIQKSVLKSDESDAEDNFTLEYENDEETNDKNSVELNNPGDKERNESGYKELCNVSNINEIISNQDHVISVEAEKLEHTSKLKNVTNTPTFMEEANNDQSKTSVSLNDMGTNPKLQNLNASRNIENKLSVLKDDVNPRNTEKRVSQTLVDGRNQPKNGKTKEEVEEEQNQNDKQMLEDKNPNHIILDNKFSVFVKDNKSINITKDTVLGNHDSTHDNPEIVPLSEYSVHNDEMAAKNIEIEHEDDESAHSYNESLQCDNVSLHNDDHESMQDSKSLQNDNEETSNDEEKSEDASDENLLNMSNKESSHDDDECLDDNSNESVHKDDDSLDGKEENSQNDSDNYSIDNESLHDMEENLHNSQQSLNNTNEKNENDEEIDEESEEEKQNKQMEEGNVPKYDVTENRNKIHTHCLEGEEEIDQVDCIEHDNSEPNNDCDITNNEEEIHDNSIEESQEDQIDCIEHGNNEPNNDCDGIDNEEEIHESFEEVSSRTTNNISKKKRNNDTRVDSPEVVLQAHPKDLIESFTLENHNAARKTKSMITHSKPKPSLAPVRESTGFSDGTKNSSADSQWDSHRITRKTIRQTFGKDATSRKSLRALVMEKSAKRQTFNPDLKDISKHPHANSTELPEKGHLEDTEDSVETNYEQEEPTIEESDHELSKLRKQTTLEMYLKKIKQQEIERETKIKENVKNSLKMSKEINHFKVPVIPVRRTMKPAQKKPKPAKTTPSSLNCLPAEVIEDMKYKPPRRFQPSNASWITKRLYKFLESKLEPKYDYMARVRAEKLAETIYNFTKTIRRYDVAPPDAVEVLKREMARLKVVTTHHDFYEFFHEYMPREIRVKVIPDIVNKISLPKHGVFTEIIK